jgi:hypothetical protein
MKTAIFKVTGREESRLMIIQVGSQANVDSVYQRLRTMYLRVELVAYDEIPNYTYNEAMTEPSLVVAR